jgi:hypothetical protein
MGAEAGTKTPGTKLPGTKTLERKPWNENSKLTFAEEEGADGERQRWLAKRRMEFKG